MKFEAFLGRIFMFIISVILIFIFIDLLSVVFIKDRRPPIEKTFPVSITRRPQPYTMFGWSEDLGYPGTKPSPSKEPNEFRIFVVGGSTVVQGNPTITDLLEEQFKDKGAKNVKVYNSGVISSVSGQDLTRILFEVSDFKPDLIIMYNGGNDILSAYSTDPRPGYPFNFIVYENNPLVDRGVRTYPSIALFAYGSNLLRYLLKPYFTKKFIPLEQIRQKVKWGSDEWKDNIARVYVKNLARANKISYAFGAEFIVFFQPMVFYKDPLAPEEQLIYPEQREYCLDMRRRVLSEIDVLKKNSPSLKFVDLSDIFDNIPECVFTDVIHTRQVYKIIDAKEMYKYIVSNFKIKGL